jgi:hypothetical protein
MYQFQIAMGFKKLSKKWGHRFNQFLNMREVVMEDKVLTKLKINKDFLFLMNKNIKQIEHSWIDSSKRKDHKLNTQKIKSGAAQKHPKIITKTFIKEYNKF